MEFISHGTAVKIATGAVSAARKVYDAVRKWLFYKTWKVSHRLWLNRNGLGASWEDLGEDIEVTTALARAPEGPSTSRIALRSRGRTYDALTVAVEARTERIIVDETRIVSGLKKDETRILNLPSFPCYFTGVSEDGDLFISYETFQVRVTSVTEDGVTRQVNLRTPSYSPIDRTLANPDHWIGFKGEALNVAEIVWAKEALAKRVWRKFGAPTMLPTGRNRALVPYGGRLYQRIPLRFLISRPIIGLWFWYPHAVLRRKFEPERYYAPDDDDFKFRTSRVRKLTRDDG